MGRSLARPVLTGPLPDIGSLVLNKRPRCALLVGYPRIEGFSNRALLSIGAILN